MTKEKPQPDTKKQPEKSKETNTPENREIGGPPGPEPTRYGDWEKSGKCVDF
ncbi:MAG: DUF1674 domain-containing protein [Rhodospirillales bacterium]|nr:DUF1674 domain-containing protein [Rhodospirillales bacterium]